MELIKTLPLKLLSLFCLIAILASCSSMHIPFFNKDKQAEAYNYPSLTTDEIQNLTSYDAIGVVPSAVIMPPYPQPNLEDELNANNLLQENSPHGISVINHFIAKQAIAQLGCKPLPKGAVVIIKKGIYKEQNHDISIATTLKWQLNTAIQSLCVPSNLAAAKDTISFTQHPYWTFNYSKNEIFA